MMSDNQKKETMSLDEEILSVLRDHGRLSVSSLVSGLTFRGVSDPRDVRAALLGMQEAGDIVIDDEGYARLRTATPSVRAGRINENRNEENDMAKKTMNGERAVVVTTAHRGVFFGYANDTDGEQIKLRASRLCIYWTADCKGFMGLAASGPKRGCKIGPPADITLRSITSVIECTPEAAKAWEAAPWG